MSKRLCETCNGTGTAFIVEQTDEPSELKNDPASRDEVNQMREQAISLINHLFDRVEFSEDGFVKNPSEFEDSRHQFHFPSSSGPVTMAKRDRFFVLLDSTPDQKQSDLAEAGENIFRMFFQFGTLRFAKQGVGDPENLYQKRIYRLFHG